MTEKENVARVDGLSTIHQHSELPRRATGDAPTTAPEPREGDVFRFHYHPEVATKMFEPNHCFDGQLVYRDGLLRDTYWGFGHRGTDTGRNFTPAEVRTKGVLIFVCNLNDTEPIAEWQFPQYDDADRFDLCHQHRCYKKFAIRKGAKKSLAKRLEILDARVKEAKDEAERAVRRAFNMIDICAEQRKRLEAGEDINV